MPGPFVVFIENSSTMPTRNLVAKASQGIRKGDLNAKLAIYMSLMGIKIAKSSS